MVDTQRTTPTTKPEMTPLAMLANKIVATQRVMLWERIWPALVPPAGVLAFFLALSWFGLWLDLARPLRIAGSVLFLFAFIYSLRFLFAIRRADAVEAKSRLDKNSGVPHRPVEAMTDTMAASSDPASQAVWVLHQKRAEMAISKLKVSPPDPALRRRDPIALRFAPFALALAALFVAGPDLTGRVAAAFQWFEPAVPPPPPRLDVWLDPPAYTNRPPLFLVRNQMAETSPTANGTVTQGPVGSVLVVRTTSAEGVTVEVSGGLKPTEAPTVPSIALERKFTLHAQGEVTIRRGNELLGRYTLAAIPDLAPTITLTDAKPTETRDGLKLTYSVKDDYGVKEAEARFTVVRKEGEAPRRTLVEAPNGVLTLPYGNQTEAEGETTLTLGEHPWAGARVKLQLHAKDDAGNSAQSEAREITLPQKVFSNPLAKALVEQRRYLVLDPDRKDRVQIALDALLIEPDRFLAKQTGTYLGLRLASQRLRAARTDEKLIEVAEWLWTMALDLEDGGLSEAEKAMREAQERLNEALERNADAAEIKKLTDELRRAMDRYMREFAERAQRENRMAEQQQNRDNAKLLNRNDMQKMLEDIERLSKEGRHAEAQELLRQLNEAMKNLQAQRGQNQTGERQRGMNESMNELDKLTRDEQQLRDRTFRDGHDRRQQGQRGEQGQRNQQGQRGQQGQQGQRGQQPGDQPGEGGEQDTAEGGEGQSLQQRQQRLREQLERLQKRMRGLGMEGEKGLGDAEQAMRDAEGQLGRGQEGRAVDSQGKALDGLRRGMQGMAKQMEQGEGEGTEQAEGGQGSDDPNRPGQPRANSDNRNNDPLGRNTRNRASGENSRMQMQGHEGGTVGERTRRILEELRRKLGEQERPRLELDYLERLLPRN